MRATFISVGPHLRVGLHTSPQTDVLGQTEESNMMEKNPWPTRYTKYLYYKKKVILRRFYVKDLGVRELLWGISPFDHSLTKGYSTAYPN